MGNTGDALPEKGTGKRLCVCVCVCMCKECVLVYSLCSPVCSALLPAPESFISLIRFIVLAEMASGDLALLEFVYRSDRVSQRNGRKWGKASSEQRNGSWTSLTNG